jgi:hypothetical protein
MRPPQELLYESESSLRLVDKAIEELGGDNDAAIDIAGMLDGLNRAASLVEQLNGSANPETAASLREELSSLSTHLRSIASHPEK